MSQNQELNPVWKAAKPFINGGLSGMASTCIIQPVDMVKVRLQLGETGGPVSFSNTILHLNTIGSRSPLKDYLFYIFV